MCSGTSRTIRTRRGVELGTVDVELGQRLPGDQLLPLCVIPVDAAPDVVLPRGSGSDGIEQLTRVAVPGSIIVSRPGLTRKIGVAAPSLTPR